MYEKNHTVIRFDLISQMRKNNIRGTKDGLLLKSRFWVIAPIGWTGIHP